MKRYLVGGHHGGTGPSHLPAGVPVRAEHSGGRAHVGVRT